MLTARRISQILFLCLYLILFLFACYPLNENLPINFFLKLDSLGGLTAAIAARTFGALSVSTFIILFVSLIAGRFFCGWICPLGTTIDGSDSNTKSKIQIKHNRKIHFSYLKYMLLITIIIAALFSLQLAGYFAPISIMTRTVTTFLYPIFVFIIDSIIAILYNLTFMEDIIYQLEEAVRGSLLPVSQSQFYGGLFYGSIFIGILSVGFMQRRSWCRNICPLGALLGALSKFRIYKRHVSDKCTQCSICAKACRMGAIPDDYEQTIHSECINCMDCQAKCPTNAISFGFTKKLSSSKVDIKRRQILGATMTGILSVAAVKSSFISKVNKGNVVRPPGALDESDFLDRCVRCGECVRVCSTAGKGLQLAELEAGWEGISTPILKTPDGYCEYNCNMCGQVCPTKAIHPLDLERKKIIKMGTAHFDKTRCIPWYYGEDCLVCEEHCPVSEKAIRFVESEVTTIDGKKDIILLPFIDESTCIGCGICTSVCPIEGKKGIYLNNANEQRYLS